MAKYKKDLLLIVFILAVAAAGFFINALIQKKPAAQLEISVDGTVIQTLDLNTDADIVIDGWDRGTNHLIIRDGAAWIEEASCPDKVCIHQGKVSQNRQMIVCLPNRMVATVRAEEDAEPVFK